MSYNKRNTYDVFISYCHTDDRPRDCGSGDTTGIVTRFSKLLIECIGDYTIAEELRVFRDVQSDHTLLETILRAARDSAVFIAIVSNNYMNSKDWCLKEYGQFLKSSREEKRLEIRGECSLFQVELVPLDDMDAGEGPIAKSVFEMKEYAVYERLYTTAEDGTPMTLGPGSEELEPTAARVAHRIAKQLKYIRRSHHSERIQIPSARTVFVARVTHDLVDKRRLLERSLRQKGLEVLPHCTVRPTSIEELEETTQRCLENSTISIHLAGQYHGDGYSEDGPSELVLQYEWAKNHKLVNPDFEVVLWPVEGHRSLELNEQQRLFLGKHECDLLVLSFEQLKEHIYQRICAREKMVCADSRRAMKRDVAQVFLNFNRCDEGLVPQELFDFFKAQNISVLLPVDSSDPATVREDFHSFVQDSADGLVFFFGQVNKEWLAVQIREVFRLLPRRRPENPLRKCLFIGPPPNVPEKHPFDQMNVLRLFDPTLVVAECSEQFQPASLQEFVLRLQESPNLAVSDD